MCGVGSKGGKLLQESREFEKGKQSRSAPWSRLTKRGANRKGTGRWGAGGAEKQGAGLPDLANKNSGYPVILILDRKQLIFSINMSHVIFGTHTKTLGFLSEIQI